MGRRSDFERIERDYYRTFDPRAVAALAPHLAPQTTFIEPCAGAGDLVGQLEALGHMCLSAYDIEPQAPGIREADALLHVPEQRGFTYITNPMWGRAFLHSFIERLSDIAPLWCLLDANWAYGIQENIANKHCVKTVPELMTRCRKIVAVGRLVWIPGTRMSGKDDVAWFYFEKPDPTGVTVFYPRK